MIEVQGAREAIEAINQLYSEEELEDITKAVLHRLKAIAMDETPVDTGAMRGAWIIEEAKLTISTHAYNPRSGVAVSEYAPIVNERVGILNEVLNRAPTIVNEEVRRYGYHE